MPGNKRTKLRGRKGKRKKINLIELSKQEKKELKQYGTLLSNDFKDSKVKATRVLETPEEEENSDTSSGESEIEDVHSELLVSFGQTSAAMAEFSDDDNDDDDDEEEEDELEITEPAPKKVKKNLQTSPSGSETSFLEGSDVENDQLISDDGNDDDDYDSDDDIADSGGDNESGGDRLQKGPIKDSQEDYMTANSEEEPKQDEEISKNTKEECFEESTESGILGTSDPFCLHYESDKSEELEGINQKDIWKTKQIEIPFLGKCAYQYMDGIGNDDGKVSKDHTDVSKMYIHTKLLGLVNSCQNKHVVKSSTLSEEGTAQPSPDGGLTNLQHGLLNIITRYQDVFYPGRDHQNGEEIRLTYCLHAINHVVKARTRIMENEAMMASKGSSNMEFRDQGLTTPKVLIIAPFKESAVRIVDMMTALLMPKGQVFVSNKKKFVAGFGPDPEESNQNRGNKPEDFEYTFDGNIDDCFRIGVSIGSSKKNPSRKSLKLFTEFYSSDIIIASPLGLRTIIGAEGEKDRDFDYLSSIECLVIDQADVLYTQNWDHMVHLMSHLHAQPSPDHGLDFSQIDFSRIRPWAVNSLNQFYRQTLVFSAFICPEISALFNKNCCNFDGKYKFMAPAQPGSITKVTVQLPQVFQKIHCNSYADLADVRFEYFKKKVLPQYKNPTKAQTLIFIASYFDYVRIRNYFKKEEIETELLCEYSNPKQVARGRTYFSRGITHFMLYTDRFHFYKRYQLIGVKHVIFYGLPRYSQFYSEVCNMIGRQSRAPSSQSATADTSCLILYSKFESNFLSEIVGLDRARKMITSEKAVHMIVTGDS